LTGYTFIINKNAHNVKPTRRMRAGVWGHNEKNRTLWTDTILFQILFLM